jgi:hypothetical protein
MADFLAIRTREMWLTAKDHRVTPSLSLNHGCIPKSVHPLSFTHNESTTAAP